MCSLSRAGTESEPQMQASMCWQSQVRDFTSCQLMSNMLFRAIVMTQHRVLIGDWSIVSANQCPVDSGLADGFHALRLFVSSDPRDHNVECLVSVPGSVWLLRLLAACCSLQNGWGRLPSLQLVCHGTMQSLTHLSRSQTPSTSKFPHTGSDRRTFKLC